MLYQEKVLEDLWKSACGNIFRICITQNDISKLYQYKEIHLLERV